jgi:hypothetical protein
MFPGAVVTGVHRRREVKWSNRRKSWPFLPILTRTATNSVAFLTPNDASEEPSSGGRRGNLTVSTVLPVALLYFRFKAERTKKQLGGFGVFEASDVNHAIQLLSKHAAVKAGICRDSPANHNTMF